MILELDAGNARIKWRIITPGDDRKVITAGAAPGLDGLYAQLASQSMGEVQRLRVSSVRGSEFAAQLTASARNDWQLEAEFAATGRNAAGVTNSYADVGAMGVDRWLAMLAAFDRARSACCVLDCGSATTFDWIDTGGVHRGGYIVPGLDLMRQSLAGKTRALDIPLRDWGDPVPGNSTAEAITGGLLAMVCGFAGYCRQVVLEGGGQEATWFLTGGDAATVSRHLSWPHVLAGDLVLDGLSLALP